MPEFILDESGTVEGLAFDDLDSFTQGFIECGFFLSEASRVDTEEFLTEEYQEGIREGTVDGTIPGDVSFGDLEPESVRQIRDLCEAFQREHEALLDEAYERDYDATQAGRDYWFTHTGSGVGYWDRKELEADGLGDRLSKAAGRGEFYLGFNPDGEGGGTVCFDGY